MMRYAMLEGVLLGSALVFFACSGGPEQGPIAGPGPGPTEPGEGIERGDGNPFLFGASAANVQSATGPGPSSTGSGMCTRCSDLLDGNVVAEFCPGSESALANVGACACGGDCDADCSDNLCSASGYDSACASCLSVACPDALQDCQEN
jgi:hypothetical protein